MEITPQNISWADVLSAVAYLVNGTLYSILIVIGLRLGTVIIEWIKERIEAFEDATL